MTHPGRRAIEPLNQPVERIAYAYHVYRIDPIPADTGESDPKASVASVEELESDESKTMQD